MQARTIVTITLPAARGYQVPAVLLLIFLISVISCTSPQVQSHDQSHIYFYQALLLDSSPENIEEKIRLFERALHSSNEYIVRFASNELTLLMSNGHEISHSAKPHIRHSPMWSAAFDSAGSKQRSLSFLLEFEQEIHSFNDARRYILDECENRQIDFDENERAAIDGRHSVHRLRYNEALNFFRTFMNNGEWPLLIPRFLIEYPNLINDLGRAFQYTQSGNEGSDLFLLWENNLTDDSDDLRFRLIFYAARIARGRGQGETAVQLFQQALRLAPDMEQSNACIWYILDLSLAVSTDEFLKQLDECLPYWYSSENLNDILDRALRSFVVNHEWDNIVKVFTLIKNNGAPVTIVSYAWTIARAIEEGYALDTRLASNVLGADTADSAAFMRIVYDHSDIINTPFLYYRSLSAAALDLPFLNYRETVINTELSSSALKFILGFFSNNALNHAVHFIRLIDGEMSAAELRAAAQALYHIEMYPQSMRLVSLYINREGYTRERIDFEMMYPLLFPDLIDTTADQFGIDPPLLFGLIRTESSFQSAVVSRAGAVGLTQLMPDTAREQAANIRRRGGPDFFGRNDSINTADPEINVYIGSHYYSYLMGLFNDNLLALMAYNGGMGRVRRWTAASSLPSDLLAETVTINETRDYGKRVIGAAAVYRELYY